MKIESSASAAAHLFGCSGGRIPRDKETGGETPRRSDVGWMARDCVADLRTWPKKPRSTVLSVEEEAIVIAFAGTR